MPTTEVKQPAATTPMQIKLSTGLPFSAGSTNKKLLHAVEEASGGQFDWPMQTPAVLSLLNLMGYEADSNGLNYVLRKGYMAAPPKQGNYYWWSKSNVVELADCFESVRRWKAMHPCHVHKLRPHELKKHQEEAQRKSDLVEHFMSLNMSDLINQVVAVEKTDDRELLAWALKERLQAWRPPKKPARLPKPEDN